MSRSKYAILGMLTIEPMTGYDMKNFTEEALSQFWHESYGNLYPRLQSLEEEGLVHGRVEERSGGPDARVYSLTPRGRGALRRWLEEPPAEDRVRSELLLKVFFGSEGRPGLTARHIREYRARQRELRDLFDSLDARFRSESADDPNVRFWLMALRRGQLTVDARLRWCQECLEALDAQDATSAS